MITPFGRKVTQRKEERKRNNAVNRGHLVPWQLGPIPNRISINIGLIWILEGRIGINLLYISITTIISVFLNILFTSWIFNLLIGDLSFLVPIDRGKMPVTLLVEDKQQLCAWLADWLTVWHVLFFHEWLMVQAFLGCQLQTKSDKGLRKLFQKWQLI